MKNIVQKLVQAALRASYVTAGDGRIRVLIVVLGFFSAFSFRRTLLDRAVLSKTCADDVEGHTYLSC